MEFGLKQPLGNTSLSPHMLKRFNFFHQSKIGGHAITGETWHLETYKKAFVQQFIFKWILKVIYEQKQKFKI